MKKKESGDRNEQARKEENLKKRKYALRLYIAGMNSKSKQAIENITKICKQELKGRYDLQVIDIYQQPELASDEQIIAAPTLIRKLPLPLRRFIGNMEDREKIIVGLDLKAK